MKFIPQITIRQGYTGKDHMLPEIARKASEALKPDGYASKASAKKAAERAVSRVISTRPLYAGCFAGLLIKEVTA